MKRLGFLAIAFMGALTASEKVYVNHDDLRFTEETIQFPIGDNVWLQTNALHRDSSGLYTFETDIARTSAGYQKSWRCPYCNKYWPIGQKCQNPECPSKYTP